MTEHATARAKRMMLGGTCTQPDRDVPKLLCGYPMPCPHHTAVIDERNEGDVALIVPTLRWLARLPCLTIGSYTSGSEIGVRAIAFYDSKEVWRNEKRLPLNSPMSALRDAYDELTREGHLALEETK